MSNHENARSSRPGESIRCTHLDSWYEDVVFNVNDIDDGMVVGQGQKSGKFYALELDDDLNVTDADLIV